jgi:hypothetical protein
MGQMGSAVLFLTKAETHLYWYVLKDNFFDIPLRLFERQKSPHYLNGYSIQLPGCFAHHQGLDQKRPRPGG